MDLGRAVSALPSLFPSVSEDTLEDVIRILWLCQFQANQNAALQPGLCTIPAGEAITGGSAVRIAGGRIWLADRSTPAVACGLATRNCAAGSMAQIILGSGYVKNLTGLIPGAAYYLGDAGALLAAKPGSGLVQGIGVALTDTEFFVTISMPS